MAQLVSSLDKLTNQYQIIDVERGVMVASFSNQQVATSFVNNGVVSPQSIQQAVVQDVNYSGGVQTPSGSTSTSNPPDPQVPSNTSSSVPVSSITDAPGSTIGSGVTYGTTDDPQSKAIFAQLKAEAAVANPVPTGSTFVKDPLYEGGGYYASTYPADSAIRTAADQQADPYSGLAGTNGSITDPNFGLSSADTGETAFIAPTDTTSGSPETSSIKAGVDSARKQQPTATQTGQEASTTDWRLRISLAKGATYLYKASGDPEKGGGPGILQPLAVTNGVIFPYTPKIDMGYKANYSPYDLTHSNYRGYFYQNSNINDINITGHFTAQNTAQANYLLAVIHFFRSATKMFYGADDPDRGSPPPLVFMSGLGQYQFNNHPCVITEFAYNLPDDVDYIRASVVNNVGLNTSTISNVLNSGVAAGKITGNARLAAAFTTPGALPITPFGSPNTPNNATGAPTYVPTKMDITLRLLPVQSRQQVSKQFSLPKFANGSLLRGGFW